jgi:hypothetical protein
MKGPRSRRSSMGEDPRLLKVRLSLTVCVVYMGAMQDALNGSTLLPRPVSVLSTVYYQQCTFNSVLVVSQQCLDSFVMTSTVGLSLQPTC